MNMKKTKNFILSLGFIFSLGLLLPSDSYASNQKTTTKKQVAQVKKNIKPIIKSKKISKKIQNKNIKSNIVQSKNNDSKKSYKPQNFSSPSNIKYAVFNYSNGKIYESNAMDVIWPIASLTKLMTAQVFVNNHPNLDNCTATITEEDIDTIKGTRTKLAFNKPYSCTNLLQVMLVASDNYAASALARSIPGWSKSRFVSEMNKTAKKFDLQNTTFVDSSGLSPLNKSSVYDYSKLAMNVVKNPIISDFSSKEAVYSSNKWNQQIVYRNSNRLIRLNGYDAELSKTGYIRESGYNLVHLAYCKDNIGVIEFGARSSEQRSNFVRGKLSKYGCAS